MRRDVVVEVINIQPRKNAAECAGMKLQTDYDVEYTLEQVMFGNNNINREVDATISLDELTFENGTLPPTILD